jgi:uncharacterized membrane protein YoaK (UPF0700 family)
MRGGQFALGLVLTALAGWVDALSFMEFGGLYTSFMSGNMILFGISAAEARMLAVERSAGAIGLFALGAFLGGLLFAKSWRWSIPIALLLEAAALGLAAAMVIDEEAVTLTIAPLAFAMGLQNHVVSKTRSDNAGTTFITGTLFRFGDALSRFVVGTDRSSTALRLLLVVAVFGIGAAAGAIARYRFGTVSFLVPGSVAAAIACASFLVQILRSIKKRWGRAEGRPAPAAADPRERS